MDNANDKALAAENARIKNEEKLSQAKKNLADLEPSDKAAEQIIDKYGARSQASRGVEGLEALLRGTMGQGFTSSAYEEVKKAIETQQQNAALRTGYTKEIQQEEGKKTPLAAAAADAKEQAEKAKSDYDEAAKLSHDILLTVQKLQGDLAAATAQNAALQNIRDQTSQVRADTAGVDLQNRVREGRGTPQENQQSQDWDTQRHAAGERGPQAGLEAANTVAMARTVYANLHGQTLAPEQHAEIHGILQEIIGFQASQAREVQRQASDLAETRRLMQDMDTHTSHGTGNY